MPLARGACGFSMVLVVLLECLLDPLPEKPSGVSPIIRQGTLTDSIQGVPAGGVDSKRAKPRAICSF